ncbi:BTB domain protein [Rhizoctonia solani AG-3 Rhs1AP]|uniref:BTB domain protein n=2 Tax=Rhizoctonia solani AG-3 TaxID=1086053 RepID=A0A074RDV5_9AGAM|nr:BTB domain protein [Rhizoctonia solani AG-3 Rhs1AP]KEP44984.1 BTB domain protein [Rhizoctonia solani 123E]
MEHDTTYTITIRGRDFLLTKSQIEFDSPNYFTSCFLGDFHEAETRHLKLSRDPDLFLIISDYLCGYEVFPLSHRVSPTRMSSALVLTNLRIDAAFYQLDGLFEKCDALIAGEPVEIKLKTQLQYLVVGCEYGHSDEASFEELMEIASKASIWSTRIAEDELTQEPLARMQKREAHTGFEGLRKRAAVERVAQKACSAELRLVGWHVKSSPTERADYIRSRLMIVLVEQSCIKAS